MSDLHQASIQDLTNELKLRFSALLIAGLILPEEDPDLEQHFIDYSGSLAACTGMARGVCTVLDEEFRMALLGQDDGEE